MRRIRRTKQTNKKQKEKEKNRKRKKTKDKEKNNSSSVLSSCPEMSNLVLKVICILVLKVLRLFVKLVNPSGPESLSPFCQT